MSTYYEDDEEAELRREDRWHQRLACKRALHWHPNDPDYAQWHPEQPGKTGT